MAVTRSPLIWAWKARPSSSAAASGSVAETTLHPNSIRGGGDQPLRGLDVHALYVSPCLASGVERQRRAGPAFDVAPQEQGHHVPQDQEQDPGRIGQGQAEGGLLLVPGVDDHRLEDA